MDFNLPATVPGTVPVLHCNVTVLYLCYLSLSLSLSLSDRPSFHAANVARLVLNALEKVIKPGMESTCRAPAIMADMES